MNPTRLPFDKKCGFKQTLTCNDSSWNLMVHYHWQLHLANLKIKRQYIHDSLGGIHAVGEEGH